MIDTLTPVEQDQVRRMAGELAKDAERILQLQDVGHDVGTLVEGYDIAAELLANIQRVYGPREELDNEQRNGQSES